MPNSDAPILTVRFTLSKEEAFDPSELTTRLALTPTFAWRSGDMRAPRDSRRFTTWGWQIRVGPRRTIDLPAILDEMAALLSPRVEEIRAAVEELDLTVDVGLHIKLADQAPTGTVGREIVGLLASLGAELDLDLYVVDADYDEPLDPGGGSTSSH